MERKVQKGPNLLADYAKVFELDVVKVQLVYEVLTIVNKE